MRFFVLPIFDGVIMDGHPIFLSWWIPATPASTTQNIGCPSIMTPSKMGKTKNLIFYSLIISHINDNTNIKSGTGGLGSLIACIGTPHCVV